MADEKSENPGVAAIFQWLKPRGRFRNGPPFYAVRQTTIAKESPYNFVPYVLKRGVTEASPNRWGAVTALFRSAIPYYAGPFFRSAIPYYGTPEWPVPWTGIPTYYAADAGVPRTGTSIGGGPYGGIPGSQANGVPVVPLIGNFGSGHFGSPGVVWGDASTSAAADQTDNTSKLQQYIPWLTSAYAQYSQQTDPRVQQQVLKAQIANYKSMKQQVPFLSFYYNNLINVAQAKLKAANEEAANARATTSAAMDFSTVGLTLGSVGAVAVGAAALLLVVAAIKTAQSK